jgi:sugar phosphate isomerase/epimerase
MALLSMNEITTYRWSFEEDVQNYAAAGIDGIAVWRQKLSDFGEEKGAELLADSGLAVSALLWAGGFTGSDGRSYRDSVQDAIEAVQLAGQLKAHSLIVYSGARAGHTHNHARRLFKNALKELTDVACEHGVALAIKPMHAGCAAEWTFLSSLDETLELIQPFDCPQLKLAFDVYHLGQEPGVFDRLVEIIPWIAIVQLGDAKRPPHGEQNRCRLGEGRVPLKEIVSTLVEADYRGFFDIELMGEDLENSDYKELIAHSQRAFATLTGERGAPAP